MEPHEKFGLSLFDFGNNVLVAFDGDHEKASQFLDTYGEKIKASPGFLKFVSDPKNLAMVDSIVSGKQSAFASLFGSLF